MKFWQRLTRIFFKNPTPANHADRLAVAYLAFELTDKGQKEARLRGVDADRYQVINVMVAESDLDVFNVDREGFLLAATYSNAMRRPDNRPMYRSPLLRADVSFDMPPIDGRELIHWIRALSAHQHDVGRIRQAVRESGAVFRVDVNPLDVYLSPTVPLFPTAPRQMEPPPTIEPNLDPISREYFENWLHARYPTEPPKRKIRRLEP